MRRSTAAAAGTFVGVALIMGVRLGVTTGTPVAAPSGYDAGGVGGAEPDPTPSSRGRQQADDQPSDGPSRNGSRDDGSQDSTPAGDLRDGRFTGAPATNPYGVVQVAVTVSDGRVTGASATYPNTGQSASINANAIPKLRQSTLRAQSAEIDAVSGATFTSAAYTTSLQAALDEAKR
jgi:uncharacterized protein with FMN-binding domain